MSLRPYQVQSVDAVFREWQEHVSTLLVLPTGTGKTEIFTEIIRRVAPKRTVVMVHREELVFQAVRRIEANTGLKCQVEMADSRAQTDLFGRADVIVTTVQTQCSGNGWKRFERFEPDSFGLLVIDESHHVTNKNTYNRVIQHYRQNSELKILGVTATPDRKDEEALGTMFETVAFDYELIDAINDGWLVPIEQQFVTIEGLDFSHVRPGIGDLNGADLALILEQERIVQGMMGSLIDIIGSKRTLIFTASVAQAEMASNILNRHRKGMAQWISGETDTDKRREHLKAFDEGSTQVMVNCAVLLEGYDSPGIECIVMAKPTTSRVCFAQMCGRGTRTLPGVIEGLETPQARKAAIAASAKPSLLIVDYAGVCGQHKLMSAADILGGNFDDAVVEEAREKALGAEGKTNATELMEAIAQRRRDEAREAAKLEEARKEKLEEQLRQAKAIAKVAYTAVKLDAFDALDIIPCKTRGWHKGKELTERQEKVWKLVTGFNPQKFKDYSYAQRKQLIDEQFMRWNKGLCTVWQSVQLKALNKPTDIGELEAARILGKPQCSAQQAYNLRKLGLDPFDFTYKTAKSKLENPDAPILPPANSLPTQPVFLGDRLSDAEINKLANYHYPRALLEKVHKDEGRRLKMRIIRNGWKPLPITDPDHPKNWKP